MRAIALTALALGLATLLKGCHGSIVESTQCAYLEDNPADPPEATSSNSNSNPNQLTAQDVKRPLPAAIINSNNNTITCLNPSYHCFGLWRFEGHDPNNKTLIKQGCWEDDSESECNKPVCWRRSAQQKTFFCCCRGNMCNLDVQDVPYEPPALTSSTLIPTLDGIQQDPDYKQKTIIIAIMSVLIVSVITIVAYLIYRLWFSQSREPLEPTVSLLEAPPTPTFESDQLKIVELIERGRYGEVWRGTLNDNDVAVKIFGPHQKQYYFNEKDLYSLPHMDHPSLPQYYGCDQRLTVEGTMQYMLVMSYIPGGMLMAYLKEHTLDWMTLCKMIHSVASGMAHLHSDMATKGGKEKPAIAHRDFNTRNILVKADLTCCVCDFGFAMKIMGSKFFRNGQEENAESSSLTDVGTLRYMAPEVLEGAVNLRDCEASLKQIDVYSLGLVIWEISSRCADLYQGMPVPEYMLPFQAEVGAHPTFEDMQLLVSRNKQRPVFPDVWKDSNPAIRALKDTIEECWDPDAEARLTSLCVEERAIEMTALWEARHKGVTPTLNPTGHLGNIVDQSIIQRNPTSSQATVAMDNPSSRDLADRNGNLPTSGPGMDSDELTEPPGGNSTNRMSRYTDNSVSTSTTETMLTASPTTGSVSEIAPVGMVSNNKANRNLAFARSNRVLQPHQGQNPTVERNTHKGSDEEIAIEGNTLIDKSRPHESSEHDGFSSATLSDDLFDTIAENLETSLVQNDMLNRHHGNFSTSHRSDHPQPLPNPRPPQQPLIVRPKQPNVPGNGSAHHHMRPAEPKQKNPKFKLKKPKEKMRLSFPFFSRSPHKNQQSGGGCEQSNDDFFPTENLREPTPGPQAALLKQLGHQRSRSDGGGGGPGGGGGTNINKSNLEPRPVPTEVCLMNGSAVVRPSSLPLRPTNINSQPRQQLAPPPAPQPHRPGTAEVGVAKLEPGNPPSGGQATVVRVRQRSQSHTDLSPTDLEVAEVTGGVKPPTSSLNNVNETGNNNNFNKTWSGGRGALIEEAVKKRGSKAVATPPGSGKNGRYSLYNDRVMSLSGGVAPADANTGNQVSKSSISLHQFGSSDAVDLNRLEAADFRC